jgi:hypothetical protein
MDGYFRPCKLYLNEKNNVYQIEKCVETFENYTYCIDFPLSIYLYIFATLLFILI